MEVWWVGTRSQQRYEVSVLDGSSVGRDVAGGGGGCRDLTDRGALLVEGVRRRAAAPEGAAAGAAAVLG